MGQVESTLMNIESDTLNANAIKEVIINRLLKDDVLLEKEANEYRENWQVLIVKKKWFHKWLGKAIDKDDNGYVYKFLKFDE